MRTRAIAFLALLVSACGGDQSGDSAANSTSGIALNGAGATFPSPIYSKWFLDYADATGVKINYQPIGSGGGIKQFSEGIVDFGATDGPMTDDEMGRTRHGATLHFPTVLGGVVIAYNQPGISSPLRLNGETIAEIFMGRITKWNDPRLAALNPSVSLPDDDILVVHRSDGSGTTYIFTDYLSAASSLWRAEAGGPGRGKEVQWPVGLGGKGNEGTTGLVKQTPGSIGYLELAYARQNQLAVAHVQNASGAFVEPTAASITAAADAALGQFGADTDYRVSIVNGPGESSYPISSFTWLLVYANAPDPAKARKLTDFMRWMYSTGQQSAASLDYAPLPSELAQRLTERLSTIAAGTPQ